jgi:cytochrome bd-type quinol oxidase subunit 2
VRLLVATYALFALAAGARSAVQLATRAAEAPVAYGLSALAAALYLVAAAALQRGARAAALLAIGVELVGVVSVGAASLLLPRAFPDETVWSAFGAGYGFVPLALPVAGLFSLLRPVPLRRPVDRGARPT